MKDIDFLPADFREKSARRRGGAWRLIAALAFLALIAGVDIRMRLVSYSTHQELADLQEPYREAQATRTQLANRQNALLEAEDQARLMAYLEHRWPLSQLLAVPTIAPPENILLTQVRLERRARETAAPEQGSSGGDFQVGNADQPAPVPAVMALKELRQLSGAEVLIVSGTTQETQAVQRFVTNLSRSPLVKSANLQSMSKINAGKLGTSDQIGSQFVVQVTIVDSLEAATGNSRSELQRISRLERQGEP